MAYARARKHYRVAQEQAQLFHKKGIFIPDDKKPMITVFAAGFLVFIFIKGILLGYLIAHDND